MKISKIRIEKFRNLKDIEIDLDNPKLRKETDKDGEAFNNITLLGKNNIGKTNLLEAIRIATHLFNDSQSKIDDEKENFKVEITYSLSSDEFKELLNIKEDSKVQQKSYKDDKVFSLTIKVEKILSLSIPNKIVRSYSLVAGERVILSSTHTNDAILFLQKVWTLNNIKMPNTTRLNFNDGNVNLETWIGDNIFIPKLKSIITDDDFKEKYPKTIESFVTTANLKKIESGTLDIISQIDSLDSLKKIFKSNPPNNKISLLEVLEEWDQIMDRINKDLFGTDAKHFYLQINTINWFNGNPFNFILIQKEGEKGSTEDFLENASPGLKLKILWKSFYNSADSQTIFLIDEPENHLHVSSQREILKILENPRHMCIIATHSPHILISEKTAFMQLEIKEFDVDKNTLTHREDNINVRTTGKLSFDKNKIDFFKHGYWSSEFQTLKSDLFTDIDSKETLENLILKINIKNVKKTSDLFLNFDELVYLQKAIILEKTLRIILIKYFEQKIDEDLLQYLTTSTESNKWIEKSPLKWGKNWNTNISDIQEYKDLSDNEKTTLWNSIKKIVEEKSFEFLQNLLSCFSTVDSDLIERIEEVRKNRNAMAHIDSKNKVLNLNYKDIDKLFKDVIKLILKIK